MEDNGNVTEPVFKTPTTTARGQIVQGVRSFNDEKRSPNIPIDDSDKDDSFLLREIITEVRALRDAFKATLQQQPPNVIVVAEVKDVLEKIEMLHKEVAVIKQKQVDSESPKKNPPAPVIIGLHPPNSDIRAIQRFAGLWNPIYAENYMTILGLQDPTVAVAFIAAPLHFLINGKHVVQRYVVPNPKQAAGAVFELDFDVVKDHKMDKIENNHWYTVVVASDGRETVSQEKYIEDDKLIIIIPKFRCKVVYERMG